MIELLQQLSGSMRPAGKRCGRCEETKALSEFSTCNNHGDGYQRWCKECHRQVNRIWYRTRGKAMRAAA